MRFVALALSAVLAFSSSVQADSIHRKLLVAKENAIKTTEVGAAYAEFYDDESQGAWVLFNTRSALEYAVKGDRLYIHSDLASAPFYYLSWVLMQGLVRYQLTLSYPSLPHLEEKELIVWIESMRYLDQLGIEINSSVDYASHPQFNYSRNRQLSIVTFSRLWREDPVVFREVILRRYKQVNRATLKSADELLTSGNRTQVVEATELLKHYKELSAELY
jgi:hypothetical protein